ncbi:MAG: MBL fold metallo-hydrolase [Anaerolineales bacterium]|nr:MBL fold metallo-hydrolase [Anaerolineales bacterium]
MQTHDPFETDQIPTSAGDLVITALGHGSLLLVFNGKNIYIDPFSRVADYTTLPKADLVLITHEHRDHLDPEALAAIRTEATTLVVTERCTGQVEGGIVMRNGDSQTLVGIEIEAVPAYNRKHKRENGEPFHPQGIGNGYILTLGAVRLYIAGDTENIPEMKGLKDITIAFLPMNLPYTMTPAMAAEAAKTFQPRILYPYHYGNTDPAELIELLEDEKEIEVRIRRLA